jgi:hypothetical protein
VEKTKVRNNADSLNEAYASPRWDISQERIWMETLVNQRTNFLIIFCSIVLAGTIQVMDYPLLQYTLLSFGFVIALGLCFAIWRASKKLDIVFDILREDSEHPYSVVDQIAGPAGSARKLVSIFIPWLCLFLIGGSLVWLVFLRT